MAPSAIVTGSDSGIGKATAVLFAERGWNVGVTWHEDREGAEQTADEASAKGGGRVEVRRLDLERLDESAAVVRELAGALGGLDALVNNAGTGNSSPLIEMGLRDWQRDIDVNLTGAFVCAQAAARIMAEAGGGGRIVNVTSIHEHLPLRGTGAYCAAKAGMGMLTKVLAVELAEHGIAVNSVAPGEIATAMTGAEDEDPRDRHRETIPAGRPGHAGEIAQWVVFLASPESSYATGASILVDGGMSLMGAQANAGAAVAQDTTFELPGQAVQS